MPPMSVIGEHLAKKGRSFAYRGEFAECVPCKLRKVCHQNLVPHHTYRITAVRPVQHDCCPIFEGKVNVIEVEPVPLRVAIPVAALKGTAYTKKWEECGASCLLKRFCNAPAVPDGTRLALDKVEGDVECLVGRKLKYATVTKANPGKV